MGVSRAVLIAGCSTGIGRATAERLANAGHPVYATARVPLPLDVTCEDSMRRAVRAVEEREGAVGVLVNNAGYSQSGPSRRCRWRRCAGSSRPTCSGSRGCANS